MITLHNGYTMDASNITIYATKISFYIVTSDINTLRENIASTDNLSEIDIDGTVYYDYTKVNTFETQIGGNPLNLEENIRFTVLIELRSQTVNDAMADIREQVSSLTASLNKSLQTISSLQATVQEQSAVIDELRANIAAQETQVEEIDE